ncbi:MAG: hypothetical protein H5T59_12095 [Anaerolineae bacterium]|nr:hypothetical protein [Anaerolineae bacterium]
MFQGPAVLLSLILAGIPAACFHIWKGRSTVDLLMYEAAGLMGFFAGQVLAASLGWTFLMIGQVHPVEGIIGSVLALFLARWLKG